MIWRNIARKHTTAGNMRQEKSVRFLRLHKNIQKRGAGSHENLPSGRKQLQHHYLPRYISLNATKKREAFIRLAFFNLYFP